MLSCAVDKIFNAFLQNIQSVNEQNDEYIFTEINLKETNQNNIVEKHIRILHFIENYDQNFFNLFSLTLYHTKHDNDVILVIHIYI